MLFLPDVSIKFDDSALMSLYEQTLSVLWFCKKSKYIYYQYTSIIHCIIMNNFSKDSTNFILDTGCLYWVEYTTES